MVGEGILRMDLPTLGITVADMVVMAAVIRA
jgi:hypothetical protein